MKVTLTLPDSVYWRFKAEAANRHMRYRNAIVEALECWMDRRVPAVPGEVIATIPTKESATPPSGKR